MADIAELNILIKANIDQFERAMREAEQGIGRLGQGLKTAGSSLTAAITLPLGLLGGAALAASAQIDALRRGLQAVTQQQLGEQGVTGVRGIAQAATDTKARLLELRQVAALPGLGFAEAIQGDIRLRAVGISADLSKRALLAFGNAIATTGGGKSELDRVTVQLGQLSAKGKVLAQDLRPIIEAAPAVATALKKLYGTVDSETISDSLAKQGKSSTEFIDVLTTELGKLPKVTGGLKNAFENLADSGQIGLAKLGDALNKAFNIEGNLGKLGDFIGGLADKFEALDPAAQKTIFVFAGIAAAAGPLLFGLGAIAAAIPSVVAGLEIMGLTGAVALGPLGVAAAGIAAAAFLIISNWDELVAYFTAGAGGTVFGNLADSVSNAAREIGRALAALTGNNLGGLITASGILEALVQSIAVGFGALADVVGGTIGAITRLLEGDFAGSLKQAQRALFGLIDPIAAVLGFTKKATASTGAEFRAFFKGVLEGNQEVVEGLQGGDIAATITRLTEGQSKALAKLRQELLDNENASLALGQKYDFLGNKAKILETGIKSLTDVGFAPASRTVQGFVAELNGVPAAMEQIASRLPDLVKKLGVTPEFKIPKADFGALPTVLLPIDNSAYTASLQATTAATRLFNEEYGAATQVAVGINEGFTALIQAGLANAAEGIGTALGDVLSGTASIGEGLTAAFASVVGAMGGFIVDFGKLLIQQSLLTIGAAALANNPVTAPAAIALGIAAIAVGSAVKRLSSSGPFGRGGGSASTSIGGGGGSAPAPTRFTPTATPNATAQGPTAITHNVQFVLSGNQLVGAIAIETDRLGRVRGR